LSNQRKSNSSAATLDQYYTDPKFAAHFLNEVKRTINYDDFNYYLEPSAGSGSFYNLLDPVKRIGVDLDPKVAGVIHSDFLKWIPDTSITKILTIGNPPFGKNANLAVKFFNHSAKFSDAIAFIVPKTFRKTSLAKRLDSRFAMVLDIDVPEYSFIFEGSPYDVWCCAQIWVKGPMFRGSDKTYRLSEIEEFISITTPEDSDFCVQRVGGKAGLIRRKEDDHQSYSTASHYFFRINHPMAMDILESIDFSSVKNNTASNPSISPSEFTQLFIGAREKMGVADGRAVAFDSLFGY
jgi:hypothetical protein